MLQSHRVWGSLEPWEWTLPKRVRTTTPVDPEGRTLSLWVWKEGIQSKRSLEDLTEFVFLGFGFSREVSCLLDVLFLYLGMGMSILCPPQRFILEACNLSDFISL